MVGAPNHDFTPNEAELTSNGRIYEYSKAADPEIPPVPVVSLRTNEDLSNVGTTRVARFDLQAQLGTPYAATSPNLLVGFVHIMGGETVATQATATSQAFYVIQGKGSSSSEAHGVIPWALGDMVVLPTCPGPVTHEASPGVECCLYWVTDEPLLRYLGVEPVHETFKPTVIRREAMLRQVEDISLEPGATHRNRLGILLGNKATDYTAAAEPGVAPTEGPGRVSQGTLTLTPVLWSLLNVIKAGKVQAPHRHQSIAIDLCVYAPEGDGIYTLMGPELDPATGLATMGRDGDGASIAPMKCVWRSGAVFVTPPGWWHSHHNNTGEAAWVLPMQDAGLLTYQRALDIRFAPAPPETATSTEAPKS